MKHPAPYYVRCTYTVGRRPDGDGWIVREHGPEWFDDLAVARARVTELHAAGYCVALGAVLDVPGLGVAAWGVEDAYGARFPGVPSNWVDLVATAEARR